MRRLLSAIFLLLLVLPVAAHADGEPKFAGVQGLLVHYKTWGKADPARPTVVFVHGLTGDIDGWRHQIEAVRKNARVVAVDLPGHGDSGAPKQAYNFDLFADAVIGVMNEAGVDKAVLVGHSLGFPVSLKVLQKASGRVVGLVSVDGAIHLQPADAAARAKQEAEMKGVIAGVKGPDGQKVLRDFIAGMLIKAPPAVRSEVLGKADKAPLYMVGSTLENFSEPAVWAERRYDVPVLAVYAESWAAGAEPWLKARFATVDMQVWRDVDHFLHLEQPARLSRVINAFVKGRAAR